MIVISRVDDEQKAIIAFDLGANGYIVKNSWFGNHAQAVLQVAKRCVHVAQLVTPID